MSNRIILNGGLSALRWNRTTISESPTLNLASAGLAGLQSGGKQSNNHHFLKSLPPKVSHFHSVQWAKTCKIVQSHKLNWVKILLKRYIAR